MAAISAEADPQLLYGGYGYAGLAGYAGYPYALGYGLGLKTAPCVNAANVPVPCAAGKRKRDADGTEARLQAVGVNFYPVIFEAEGGCGRSVDF